LKKKKNSFSFPLKVFDWIQLVFNHENKSTDFYSPVEIYFDQYFSSTIKDTVLREPNVIKSVFGRVLFK